MKKALYMLAGFSDRDFDWLLTTGRRNRIPAGNALIREGEPTHALYIVLEGKLAVSVAASGGEEIAQIQSGEIVGETSFVDSRPPSATVMAVEDSLVWSVPRSLLSAKLMQDVEFSAHFYHSIAAFLCDRMRDTVSRLGYSKDQAPLQESDLNPQTMGNLELAKVRLNWLLRRVKEPA
ncbi:MAG: cyclic nucleotide-binding domain-containing protein [Oculatellaceae cyanobacterium Prado106]|jgi:CRP-like cAMP-binding protein|nr:cyclic nucleotide-binding domain-containing protein [Oculatellaceae cyanobacterium Prado106]